MNEKQRSINEIIAELKIEDIKQDDLALECIENMVQNQNVPRYDVFLYEDGYAGIYQESKVLHPLLNSENNIV